MKLSFSGSSRGCHGFTRPDLAGVLAVVALIGLVQFPLAGNSRVNSRAATCLDNHRRLALAWQMYAADNAGWFPPNPDDSNSLPGRSWVGGNAGPGGPDEFNSSLIANRTRSLLVGFLHGDAQVFRCPADVAVGRNIASPDPALRMEIVPAARSVAMNGAIGTNPNARNAKQPVDAPWLDNNHSHVYGQRWLTYGRDSHLTMPGPANTLLLLDEDHRSINDCVFAFGMVTAEWIDFPATWHDGAAGLSFTDGHVEMHRWVDTRTPITTTVARRNVPNSPDWAWIRDRTSALIPH